MNRSRALSLGGLGRNVVGLDSLTAQERHCLLLEGGESEVPSRRKGPALSVHALDLINVVWQRVCVRWKHS